MVLFAVYLFPNPIRAQLLPPPPIPAPPINPPAIPTLTPPKEEEVVVVEEPTGGTSGSSLFFTQESLENTLPQEFQQELIPKGSQSQIELDGSRLRRYTNIPNEIVSQSDNNESRPNENILDIIRNWFSKLFLERTVRSTGFVQFTRPNDLTFTNQSNPQDQDGATMAVYEGATADTERWFTPEGISSSRYPVSFPASAKEVRSTRLKELYQQTAESQCVPIGILLAISHRESPQTFTYSEEEFERFSTNNWQLTMTESERARTECKNTCANPGAGCSSGDDVQGPMQFNWSTWVDYIGPIKLVLQDKYGIPLGTYEPHRCNVRDAMIGAALKMKGVPKSESSCTNWGLDTVYRVAENYCGSGACSNTPACGVGYCAEIWGMYNNYMTPETM